MRFGVEPVCRVLTEHGCQIAPSTYYAWRSRRPAARTISDAVLVNALVDLRTGADGRASPESLYGYRKTWHALRARGHDVPRCTVVRLMRQAGLTKIMSTRSARFGC